MELHAGSNRSSNEELRGDDVTKEDETVVDSEQGSSTSRCWWGDLGYPWMVLTDHRNSAHAYYLAVAARCRPQSGNATHVYSGAAIDAGEDYQVRAPPQALPACAVLTASSFMAHPETLLPLTKIEDPIERFVAVVKFYLSGWHIKPP